jgi:excisionase family DNA binding protein
MKLNEPVQNETIISRLRKSDTYLTSAEVMAITGITRQTLCTWVRRGVIQAVRIGKGNAFDPGTLASWLEARSL